MGDISFEIGAFGINGERQVGDRGCKVDVRRLTDSQFPRRMQADWNALGFAERRGLDDLPKTAGLVRVEQDIVCGLSL